MIFVGIGYGIYTVLLAQGAVSPALWNTILILGLLLTSGLSVLWGPWVVEHFQSKDPRPFVLDEAAGICLTWLFLPMPTTLGQLNWIAFAVFLAFRFFDILKIYPANKLESLPQGWGILMDDLMAAVYANLFCQLVFRAILPMMLSRV
jgi:phosphatidylglycerophosphatase A